MGLDFVETSSAVFLPVPDSIVLQAADAVGWGGHCDRYHASRDRNARSAVANCPLQKFESPARWSPDGAKIVVGLNCDTDMGYDESIVLDAKTGAAGTHLYAGDVTWAPTGGRMLGVAYDDNDTYTYMPAIYGATGSLVKLLPAGDGSTSMVKPVFSKDGANVAVGTYDEFGSATTPAGLWTIPAVGGARRLVVRGVDIAPMQWR